MPVVSSIFLVLAFVLAVTIGPQTRGWTWGPGLVALAAAVISGAPCIWKKKCSTGDFTLLACAAFVVSWFGWRAANSPVGELAQADHMLLAGAVGTFIAVRCIEGHPRAERILLWGLALLLLANVIVIGKQVADPTFNPIFVKRTADLPSGFYAHYNEAANYLIASSMLLGAAAIFGKQKAWTRVFLGSVALAAVLAIYFTRSRGGILAIGFACGIFWLAALFIGKRGAKWFVPALIGGPFVALLLGGLVWLSWERAQEARQKKGGVEAMMDDNSRLYFYGAAISCIELHPLAGGGSRSFSWEYFRFAENKLQGDVITHLPEQVHNELLQAGTDYGIIGAGLLIGLLGASVLVAVLRIGFPIGTPDALEDAWRVGGLTALAGMFVQSCFSFVFHLLPGAMLLGLALGMLSRSSKGSDDPDRPLHGLGSKLILTGAVIACTIVLAPLGWKGARVTYTLWPTHFSKHPATSSESKVDALTAALAVWPLPSLYQERAIVLQEASTMEDGLVSKKEAEAAIADYEKAGRSNPHDPNPVINRANILSHLDRDAEAEAAFDLAIHLQGGMEPSFRGHFLFADHLMRKGVRQFSVDNPEEALPTFELAAAQMEQAVVEMHWVIPEMRGPRVSAQESLGATREANGDYKGAMQAYDFAVTLIGGNRAHYRAGVLQGKIAARAWSARKPAEALYYFQEAKQRISMATELPVGVTPSQKVEYLAYLDETINYLMGAKIKAVKPPE